MDPCHVALLSLPERGMIIMMALGYSDGRVIRPAYLSADLYHTDHHGQALSS